ncbi:Acetyltransferase (GNAT) family protein [Roseomonas rosea]|uniref:Acetyltransferase (GNAT) family protein n=1 Tax=Muricoccus roseus TaxID=198092 RepID=A0A1M6GEV1_9PROT|nr:GNAT family N-acetyltransferase [Roseomonas rosea]SHJ08437.1 Acetyltransferase (GNAT) family protein [Roseomonas rosea]
MQRGPEASFEIGPARGAADLAAVAQLFRDYAASLGIDLGFQGFEAELAGLPGRYAPPGGALLLARGEAGDPLGCVALRQIGGEGACEMKRLYVAPTARGLGLGRALVEAILAEAARLGHAEMRLDSLPSMTGAIALYRSMGFTPIAPYYATPIAGTMFLARRIAEDPAG